MADRKHRRLIAEELQKTVDRLHGRIVDRFPGSGLSRVCGELAEIAKESDQVLEWISTPNIPMRVLIGTVLALLGAGVVYSLVCLKVKMGDLNWPEFLQMTEAALSELVFIGAGVGFLVTFETRRKRKRVIKAVNQLRYIAHLIDAHQLTKDPDAVAPTVAPTTNSPARELDRHELSRYLDYCSEMLSLAGKLGFLYVQDFDDPAANSAVNDLEDLTTGLSQKIWQKIIILSTLRFERIG